MKDSEIERRERARNQSELLEIGNIEIEENSPFYKIDNNKREKHYSECSSLNEETDEQKCGNGKWDGSVGC